MKPEEIRKLSRADMQEQLGGFRQELFNLRFQHSTGQLENTQRLSQVRKNIARILTILREKEAGKAHDK
ncbi:ribosomal protein L29 [Desulfonatronospira thiodismutans ASO3-1]|uniref:Large ribosomal subunit protein uL29 n=1 Tax=Desulfonatronospira thiodismutans ASO3-1 TaxID=555779 RepID=D6SUM5_9BACT|nr:MULTISPECIES: 50S ribosomal protein L29 [Desulfonatronospira]EFI33005.1 ribosomal protein L29 [Desulfonatronospira thiodismutans ASO3-1]RQD74525.1 MAG: 50S ribosomal protein L29 [Desulfonatronospira sp. MSAO_Bac3]